MSGKWPLETLDQLCDFKNGLWKGKKGPLVRVGVIRNTNFTKHGELDDANIAYIDVEEKQYKTRKLKYGDLLLEKSGGGPKQPVGRVIPFEKRDGEFSFSNFTSVIRVRNKAEMDFSFLHRYLYFLYVSGETESMQKHSTNIRNLQLKEYKNIEVPIPPISEQRKIVSILDEAFEGIETAIANTDSNLANARELFESYLNSTFSRLVEREKEVALDQHIRFIDYRGKTPKKTTQGLRLITAKNVRMGFLQREPEEFVHPDTYDEWMTRGIPEQGDVLFTTEAPLGFVCQLDTAEKVVFAQRIITMQPDRRVIDPAYLKFALRSAPIQERIHENATGATATGIKASLLKKITLPLPAISEQKNVASSAEELEVESRRLELLYAQKLTALTELKQSLLQKAFSGELTAETVNETAERALA